MGSNDNNYGLNFRVTGGKLNGAGSNSGSGASNSGAGASNYPGKSSASQGAGQKGSGDSAGQAEPVELEEEHEKAPEKEEPELKLVSVAVVEPSGGFLLKRPFKVTGSVEWLKERLTKAVVTVEAIGMYAAKEDSFVAGGIKADIATDNSFVAEFSSLFEPKAWTDAANRTPDATWELFARARATNAHSPIESKKITFPQEAQAEPDIKLGHYDDKGSALNPTKYTTEGEQYLSGTPVFDWQGYLVDFNYLTKSDKIGVFGPKSEAAVKFFQKDALATKRCKGNDGKIIDATQVSFTGSQNGIIDAPTREELQRWRLEKWKRPMVPLRHGEGDDEGVNNRKVERGSDDYHPGRVVLEKQEQLKAVAAYSGKMDGWFWDKMKTAVALFQDHAAKGTFLVDGVLKEIEDKLIGYTKGVLDIPTQDMLEKVKEMGGKVEDDSGGAKELTSSVGLKGVNNPVDIKNVKKKLKALGYPIDIMDEKCEPETIKAIQFYQVELMDIASKVKGYEAPSFPDGLILKGSTAEKRLFGSDAPKYTFYSKGSVKAVAQEVQTKITDANGSLKKTWDTLQSKWNFISVYLPNDSIWTSGYRSSEDQRSLLQKWYNEKYKTQIIAKYSEKEWKKYNEMQGVDDAKADPEMVKMIKGAAKQLIAVPGRSAHEKGLALDVGGTPDVEQVKALLWMSVALDDVVITKILPERNGCIHFEYK